MLLVVLSAVRANGLLQDRHVVIKELLPDPGQGWAGTAAGIEPRGYAAVFDGHKRSEAAEMAAARMHPYMARWAMLLLHKRLPT
jgi:hypothetical protein